MRAEIVGRSGALGALLLLILSAPAPATTADNLCAASADPCVVATPIAVTDESVIDLGARELRIDAGGTLEVGGGTMTIRAGRLTVNSDGFIRATGTTSTSGGTINIEAGTVSIAGSIDARGAPGGTINLASTEDVTVGGTTTAPGLGARSLAVSDIGGTITVTAATATVTGVIALFGGTDDLGGDLAINTTGSLEITGSIDASGGDGGSIELEAGAVPGAGDIVVGDAAVIEADATIGGGYGGIIDILAHGDGVEHGHVTVDGLVSANGKTGGEDSGGGLGGCITITADGDLVNTRAAAVISAVGGGPDGDGGEVELTSDLGTIAMSGSADVGSAGDESGGGDLTIDAFGDVTVDGQLAAVAGASGGGEIDVNSDFASVQIGPTASIDVDSSANGGGGTICLDGGTGAGTPRSVIVGGALSASGSASGGGGGTIQLEGGDAVWVQATGSLHADGAFGGGPGGTITVDVTAGPALIDAPMTVAGGNPTGPGGFVSVDASQRVVLTAVTDARGFGLGGQIGLSSSGGGVEVLNDLLASSTTAGGGTIEIVSAGDATIAGSLIADGVALPGASIDITACTITVCGFDSPVCPSNSTGILSALGPEGRNHTSGRDATVILGTMRADPNSGHNVLVYNGDPDSEPFILGTVTPTAEVVIEDLKPCPACGDDREFIVAEIFDGDNPAADPVSCPAGSAGADANQDGFVTAADLVAIVHVVSP